MKEPKSEVFLADCMDIMKTYPDKYFDLAVVDPPYGINFAKTQTGNGWIVRENKEWDKQIPSVEYFIELKRISKNYIIWGANYMVEYLPPSMGWIFWDKGQRNFSLADGELAFSSFNKALRVFSMPRGKHKAEDDKTGGKIHPTQKPIALYDWIFKNYSKEGDKIIDTHLGSVSSRISAYKARLDFVGCEIDKDYYEAQEKRFRIFKSQLVLF